MARRAGAFKSLETKGDSFECGVMVVCSIAISLNSGFPEACGATMAQCTCVAQVLLSSYA